MGGPAELRAVHHRQRCGEFGGVPGVRHWWIVCRAGGAPEHPELPDRDRQQLFFLVLFASASLWAASGLQVLYLLLGFAGWWQWLRGRADTGTTVVRRTGWPGLAMCMAFLVVGTGALYVVLKAAGDAAPFLDALTTCLALVAQWLLNTRRIESWYFWIAADLIYIPLYFSQGLVLTAAVYVMFLAMCVIGLRAWSREPDPRAAAEVTQSR